MPAISQIYTERNELMSLPERVVIYETVLRDGFQGEGPNLIPTQAKIKLGNMLTAAGFSFLEVASFAHPKWMPQVADAESVYTGIEKRPDVVYSALVPNVKAMERAISCNVQEVFVTASATESHSKANLNASIAEVLDRLKVIADMGKQHGMRIRGAIATAFGCPFEGAVEEDAVLNIALAMESFGFNEIVLGDTTGMANPEQTYNLSSKLLRCLDTATLALHFHQAGGIEFANIYAGLKAGVTVFDGSVGGLGGCPNAPGALGNASTAIMLEMFERMGIKTGIDKDLAIQAGEYAKYLAMEARKV